MENKSLSEKRKELVDVLRSEFGIHNSKAWMIMKRVHEQDKQVVKELKEFGELTILSRFGMVGRERWAEEIDKIFGEELTNGK